MTTQAGHSVERNCTVDKHYKYLCTANNFMYNSKVTMFTSALWWHSSTHQRTTATYLFVVVSSKSNSHTRHKLTGCDIFTVPRTSSESSNFKHSSSRAYNILYDIIIQTENKRVLGIDMKDQLYLSSGCECQNWVFFACAIHEGISQLKLICK